ncbi:PA2817 family protein [Kineobactrum salinum]|uniref:Dehydrogenase n=1 Tax=Kineobactrum salinum TaxID=2708301 RepID=A0A6C0TX21_9GAMM|nr:PA2817 family protein [Kineobactrum salinum]QIB64370.1 hypothetical protein G3T16_02065 [Kineobactrum salinum]
MNDTQYLQYCRQLWRQFSDTLGQRSQSLDPENPLRQLASEFSRLGESDGDLYLEGPELVQRLFSHHPEFAPTLPRSLLWFLGRDCLHVMADEEIRLFQTLDDERHAAAARGEVFDYSGEASARLPLA